MTTNKNSQNENNKLLETRAKVTEITEIMKDNINKTVVKGDKLKDLEDQTGELAVGAEIFNASAQNVRKRMWWNNMKIKLIIAAIILIILIVIGLIIGFSIKKP